MKLLQSKKKFFLTAIVLFITANLYTEAVIEEVLVTAEKRTESRQDVSKSVEFFTLNSSKLLNFL